MAIMTQDYNLILTQILSAAASALTEQGRAPGRIELTPGLLPAWDDCCKGQLYLRVMEIYPSGGAGGAGAFPQIDAVQRGAAGGSCSIHLLAVHIGLGILRCAATVGNNMKAPTPAKVSEDGAEMLADLDTLLNVLVCGTADMKGIQTLKIDKWQPLGVDGGCHGGEWGAYLAITPCLCAT